MIISPGRRYVFVHIPKTGGPSLALAFEGRAMKGDILVGDTPKARRRRGRLKRLRAGGRLGKHATLAEAWGLLTGEEMRWFLTFTLVRNPWDRLVSYYCWIRQQRFAHPDVAGVRSRSFGDFLRDESLQARLRAAPAAQYMRDAPGREVPSLYIRLEHFDEDAAPLWRHLGFRLALPHVNRSRDADDFRTLYDDGTRALVAGLCAEDIARFGYRFEPSD